MSTTFISSIALLALDLALAVKGLFLTRRRQMLACRKCGYELTGNTSGRCPECNTATTRPARSRRVRRNPAPPPLRSSDPQPLKPSPQFNAYSAPHPNAISAAARATRYASDSAPT